MKHPSYSIGEYGAIGDGSTVNTAAIQQAIDACHAAGGGAVYIPSGTYCTGTIELKSRVELVLAPGAVLLGSPRIADYRCDCGENRYRGEPEMDRCLIFARGAQDIGIRGQGIINGNGALTVFPNADDPGRNRPMLMRLIDCRGIRVREVTFHDPAGWTSAWISCHDIVVDGITIHSRVNDNGDGLDFDGCTRVRVSNSDFDTSDDCICLQTSHLDTPCRDVVISNCTFCSKWAGIRIGLLSRANLESVTVSNCTFRDISDAGLKIQMCEGATLQNMVFGNLVMQRVPRPIFVTLAGQRCCVDAPPGIPAPGQLRRLHFHDILIDNSELDLDSHLVISGVPGHVVEDISLSNISLLSRGGAGADLADPGGVVELDPDGLAGHWPEYYCFKRILPAAGLYARHVRGLRLQNLDLRTVEADARPAVVTDSVSDLKDERS